MKRVRWMWVTLLCFFPLLAAAFMYRPLSHEGMKQRAYHAAERGDLDTLKRLLDEGLSPNARVHADEYWPARILTGDRDYFKLGIPLTMVAYRNNHEAVLRYLLERGADVNNVESAGATLLMDAGSRKDLRMVKDLLARGADPYSCWKDGTPPYSADPQIQALLDDAKEHCSDRGLPCKRHRGHPSPDSF